MAAPTIRWITGRGTAATEPSSHTTAPRRRLTRLLSQLRHGGATRSRGRLERATDQPLQCLVSHSHVTIIYYFGWLSRYARRRTEDTHELLTPPRQGTPTTRSTVPGSPGSTVPQITKAPHVGAPPCARGLVVLPWGFGGVISVRSSFSLADVGAWCVRARCGTLCSSGAPGVYKNCLGHARTPSL